MSLDKQVNIVTLKRVMELLTSVHLAAHTSNGAASINFLPVTGIVTAEVIEALTKMMSQLQFMDIMTRPENDGSITLSFTLPTGEI
jgi:hypothetical protein